jgi:hypothetical protein
MWPGSRLVMPKETEADPVLRGAHVWIPIAFKVSLYAERRISSLAERANLLAKHANDRPDLPGLRPYDQSR